MSRALGALNCCNCESGSTYRSGLPNNLFHATYGALGVVATRQCTINNFIFGNATHQSYEAISGGSGARHGVNGTGVWLLWVIVRLGVAILLSALFALTRPV